MEEKDAYQSGEVFLSMAQTEYQNEKDRAAALDAKIAFSIPVISTYFFLLVQDTNFKALWHFVLETEYSVLQAEHSTEIMAIAFYFAAVFTAFASLIWMISASWTHHFKELNIRRSYPIKTVSMPKEFFSAKVAKDYLRKIEQNRDENRKNYSRYQSGWGFSIGSLFCFLLYTLMT